jgi:hypothetical protein
MLCALFGSHAFLIRQVIGQLTDKARVESADDLILPRRNGGEASLLN